MAIRNIIFDFGGVFLDVDYSRTEKAFIKAGISNFRELYSQNSASPLFEDLEKGNIGREELYPALRKISGVELSNDQITHCWNAILGQFYPEAIQKAKELKNQYRLFLFANPTGILRLNLPKQFQGPITIKGITGILP